LRIYTNVDGEYRPARDIILFMLAWWTPLLNCSCKDAWTSETSIAHSVNSRYYTPAYSYWECRLSN